MSKPMIYYYSKDSVCKYRAVNAAIKRKPRQRN